MTNKEYRINNLIGLSGLIIAMTFSISTTIYFGNNILPNSIIEWLCDFVVIVIAFISWRLLYTTYKNK